MFNCVTLKNGIKIAIEQIPFVRSAAFGIWVKNGSRNEDAHTNGISHFIEHMLFKGTENRTAKEIADEMDQVGGQLNAFTTKEYTCYYTKTLDTHLDIAIDVLADMFFNSKFDNIEIQKERNVIIEEISMYEDTPEELVHDILQLQVWENDSLGYSILGTEKTISTFDHALFKDYYNKNYRPENTVISIAGNIDVDKTVKKIEDYFGSFKASDGLQERNCNSKYTPKIITKDKDIEQIHMCIGFPSISIASDKTYALSILNTILGGGMSSRLFQSIREDKGLAYSVYSYNSSYVDTGIFSIYAGLNPTQTEEVFKLIVAEVRNLTKNPVSAEQLCKTKEQFKSNYILSLESSSSRMSSIGRSQLMLNRILSPDDIIKKIDGVTLDDLNELVKKVFNLDNLSLSIVGNLSQTNIKAEDLVKKYG